MNEELLDAQVGFRKGRGTIDQTANTHWIIEKGRKFQKKIYFCFINYAKAFDCIAHNKLWKILEEKGITDHFICLLRNQVKKQQLEMDMKQQTGSKLGKEYIKVVYWHHAYLTYMHSTSCKNLGWMKLESSLLGEIPITSHMQCHMAETEEV